MARPSRQVGEFNSWFILRWATAYVIALAITGLDMVFTDVAPIKFAVIALAGAAFASLFYRHYAYGLADDNGLLFRRYFKMHSVVWEDIASVDFNAREFATLVVTFKRPVGFSRIAKFSYINEAWRLKSRPWPPEVGIWIAGHLPRTP